MGVSVALTIALLFQTSVTSADTTQAEEGKRKINLSGRQRMLSQRMAKAACFAALGVDTDAHLSMTADAHQLFDKTLKALRDGSTEVGLTEETSPRILSELGKVELLWVVYGQAIDRFLKSGGSEPNAIESIAGLNIPTLVLMNAAVGKFERVYSGGNFHPALALTINVAGRQRMLTQKASKEFCFVLLGMNADAHRVALGKTIGLFAASLEALRFGSSELGLPQAPTEGLSQQLALVDDLWAPMMAILSRVAKGEVPSNSEIAFVAHQNNQVLVEMNRAVGMYENL